MAEAENTRIVLCTPICLEQHAEAVLEDRASWLERKERRRPSIVRRFGAPALNRDSRLSSFNLEIGWKNTRLEYLGF